MPRPYLGELAYLAYCRSLDRCPQWDHLPWQDRLAWGSAVQAALQAALDVTRAVVPVVARPAQVCQQAYVLYALEHRPQAEVCAQLGISRRTLYRYIAHQRRAIDAA